MNELQVTVKNKFGRDHIYPANEIADIFARITACPRKRSTLDVEALEGAHLLGFDIVVTAADDVVSINHEKRAALLAKLAGLKRSH